MSDCGRMDLRDRIPEYVHGALGAQVRAEMDTHLASCAECREEATLVRAARAALVARSPKLDLAAISVAARAAGKAGAARANARALPGRGLTPAFWRAAAAIAIVATGAIGYWLGTRRSAPAVTPPVAVQPEPSPAPEGPIVPQPLPDSHRVSVPPFSVPTPIPAPRPAPKQLAATGIDFGPGVGDLPADQVNALMNALGAGAPFEVEPMSDEDLGSGL